MSDPHEKTPAENPFAKVVQRLMREELRAFESRLALRDSALEERVSTAVVAKLMPTFSEYRTTQERMRRELDDVKRRLSNLEEIVRCSRADTEPPPPSGMQS